MEAFTAAIINGFPAKLNFRDDKDKLRERDFH